MYCYVNDYVPITDPRLCSPWSVILILGSLKISCADFFNLLPFTIRMVFAGFGQYPKSDPFACRYSHHFVTPFKSLTAELSSVNLVSHMYLFHIIMYSSLFSACINGRVDMVYITIRDRPIYQPIFGFCRYIAIGQNGR